MRKTVSSFQSFKLCTFHTLLHSLLNFRMRHIVFPSQALLFCLSHLLCVRVHSFHLIPFIHSLSTTIQPYSLSRILSWQFGCYWFLYNRAQHTEVCVATLFEGIGTVAVQFFHKTTIHSSCKSLTIRHWKHTTHFQYVFWKLISSVIRIRTLADFNLIQTFITPGDINISRETAQTTQNLTLPKTAMQSLQYVARIHSKCNFYLTWIKANNNNNLKKSVPRPQRLAIIKRLLWKFEGKNINIEITVLKIQSSIRISSKITFNASHQAHLW